jgi:hypothetical protein
MVNVGSQDNQINITVSSGGNTSSVNATPDMAMYYSDKAKEWATSNRIVDGQDFSSKYYAKQSSESATQAGKAKELVLEAKDVAVSEIAQESEIQKQTLNANAQEQISTLQEISQVEQQELQSIVNHINTGKAVYIGETAPTDDVYSVWVSPEDNEIDLEIQEIKESLEGVVNTDLSNLSEEGEAHFDNRYVNIAGDTMTGQLVVENGYIYNKGASTNTIDFTTTDIPSSAINGGNYNFRDKNNQTCGQIINQLDTNGYLRTSLVARRSVNGAIKTAQLWVCIKHDGTVATYAPTPSQNDSSTKIATTAFCDGVTTVKNKTIVSNLTMTPNQEYTYSLSDYLPNDSNKYEVLFCVYADMSGNNVSLQMKTDFQTNYVIVSRGSGSFAGASTRLTIGTGRSITIKNTASPNIVVGLVAFEYRKVR